MRIRSSIILLAVVACISGCGSNAAVPKEESLTDEQHGAIAELQGVIDDYVREVVEEAKGVRVIYTDGAFDDDIRREAKRRGVELEPNSMLGWGGQVSLREAVLEKGEDVAFQLGFELWKRAGKELPPCSGVLARSGKMPETDRQSGIGAAYRLGERILKLYERDVVKSVSDKKVKGRFHSVQWRIARMARMRSERETREGLAELAMKDLELAQRLDENNAALKRLFKDEEKNKERTLRSVTPRESLKMALARADFTMAQRFAEPILKDDPDDFNANFATGMYHFCAKRWARAEEYLRRCLVKKPREPAVWNNLAVIYMHQGRFEEAEEAARKALGILPDSAEVKDTIKQIREAREKAAARKP